MKRTNLTPATDPKALALPTAGKALPADRHPLAVYATRSASENSRRGAEDAARRALAALTGRDRADIDGGTLRAFPWQALRYQHVAAVKAALLSGGSKPSTVNVTLAHVRGIVREAWRLGYLSAEDLARVEDVGNVKATSLPAGRSLSTGEIAALFSSCDGSPSGVRDAALLAVLYVGGLRRSEAVALDVTDYDRATGAITVRHGKGDKARIVYVENGGKSMIDDWIAVRGTEAGALFHPVAKGGKIERRPMTSQSVFDMCARRAAVAGVATFTPHDLRRSFVSDLLDAGADVGAVQRLAGHANVNTTLRCDRRPEESKRKAASLLHVPYRRRRQA